MLPKDNNDDSCALMQGRVSPTTNVATLVDTADSLVDDTDSLVDTADPLVDVTDSLVDTADPLVDTADPLVDNNKEILTCYQKTTMTIAVH